LDEELLLPDEEEGQGEPEDDLNAFGEEAVHDPGSFKVRV
jgi:hypothetical protein